MTDDTELPALRRELTGLFQYIQRVRQEIAAIQRPAEEGHRFASMGEQLDAIVGATEEATNSIMAAMENVEQKLTALRKAVDDQAKKAIDDVFNDVNTVFEACAFQDITGQRISKVVKSVTYVEARVDALSDVWGSDELDKVDVQPERAKTADEKLMHGPQDADKAISQAEIDALFD
jgi:chemotaxis protein CheZ